MSTKECRGPFFPPAVVCTLLATILSLSSIPLLYAIPNLDKMIELAKSRYGDNRANTVILWRELIANAPTLTEQEQLEHVNNFFNKHLLFADDIEIWGIKDYWATPLESMGRQQGDCEDFSIAKYVTLQLMGVPLEKLRMTYVKAKIGGPYSKLSQAHMVLSYYPSPNSEPLLLDNLIAEIRPASQRTDLYPIFSFNSEGLWVGSNNAPTITKPATRLSRWHSLLSRMQQEGL